MVPVKLLEAIAKSVCKIMKLSLQFYKLILLKEYIYKCFVLIHVFFSYRMLWIKYLTLTSLSVKTIHNFENRKYLIREQYKLKVYSTIAKVVLLKIYVFNYNLYQAVLLQAWNKVQASYCFDTKSTSYNISVEFYDNLCIVIFSMPTFEQRIRSPMMEFYRSL